MTNIAVLGAGHGGCACAVDLALKGFEVSLCSSYNPSHIRPIIEKGGLEYSGKLGEGFVSVNATTSLEDVVKDATIILVVVPSTIHESYARLLAPILKKKNLANEVGGGGIGTGAERLMVLLNGSTTGGSLYVSSILREEGVPSPLVCETDILNYACRLQLPTCVKIHHKVKKRLFSCFPARYNNHLFDRIKGIFPELVLADNVLQTSLSNLNAMLHPSTMVLNTGWIEHTSGNFLFYSQGVTSAVARAIEAVDRERMAIVQFMDIKPETLEELFCRYGFTQSVLGSIHDSIKSSDTIQLIQSPDRLDHRYLMEDVGYGLVPMACMARRFGINVPTIESIVNISCILNDVDHWVGGLTLQKLGISQIEPRVLRDYLYTGLY
jgi:opine dehydrogenase